jgi:hypothetical protein
VATQLPITAWPGARSSGGRGLARPVVPGGVSLLTVLVSTRSSVVTNAASIAIITATAKSRMEVGYHQPVRLSSAPVVRLVSNEVWLAADRDLHGFRPDSVPLCQPRLCLLESEPATGVLPREVSGLKASAHRATSKPDAQIRTRARGKMIPYPRLGAGLLLLFVLNGLIDLFDRILGLEESG